jgi:hypothetical protein
MRFTLFGSIYALRDMSKPIGISEFELTQSSPKNLRSSLPTIEEIENELKMVVTCKLNLSVIILSIYRFKK